jgi:hypothetical protein
MNSSEAVAKIWSEIEAPTASGQMAGVGAPGRDGVLLAIDSEGLRHVLIEAGSEEKSPKWAGTRGLEVAIDELQVGTRVARLYLDLSCRDASMNQNFTGLATEICDALAEDRRDAGVVLEAILEKWRWFWGNVPDELSGETAVGLFGELWFLEYWMKPVTAEVLNGWAGPDKDRHDFKWPAASVEVKSTRVRTDGAAKHQITNLDQLDDPEVGELYLFSLRVIDDPIGQNSLSSSVKRLRKTLEGDTSLLHKFDEQIARYGFTPGEHVHADRPLRVIAEELYRVGHGFPRLTASSFPNGVPSGVDGISYTLDLVACEPWRRATAPGPVAEVLRASVE